MKSKEFTALTNALTAEHRLNREHEAKVSACMAEFVSTDPRYLLALRLLGTLKAQRVVIERMLITLNFERAA